ncbi:hypothetical protein FE236_08990 [Mariprofundus erugo]|uniref:VTT domain-containing protein n=1 Tax=Mariprofundus erugo TaxID=2528639 RepID=UPI0010FEA85A|nr:VTT domain-containing protein [Mariprofundus erugo]TLS75686.1 hypothetical protein FE236_08990 [Mariprofundus erugo]
MPEAIQELLSSHSWWEICAVLFASTFVHEDVAIVAAGYFIDKQHLPFMLVLLTLYIGVVLSDLTVYGLGALARRTPWARRFVTGFDSERASAWVSSNLGLLIVLCRIVPGLLFPAFVACGWLNAPFRRFFFYSVVTAVPFVVLTLLVVLFFGGSVLQGLGDWAWLVVLASLLGLSLLIARHPRLNILERKEPAAVADACAEACHHAGMPPLTPVARGVRLIEKIPDALFYTPLTLYWLWLGWRYGSMSLPSAANPCIEGGGCWGESKAASLDGPGSEQRCWVAPYVRFCKSEASPDDGRELNRALEAMREAGIEFPVVAKPDIGWQGFGVSLVDDVDMLDRYIRSFPAGVAMLLQAYIPYEGEAGVFYIRKPGDAVGVLHSLALVYFPYVVGDGVSTLRELILKNPRTAGKSDLYLGFSTEHSGLSSRDLESVPEAGKSVRLSMAGSGRLGSIYCDGRSYITPAMTARFDALAQSMPEFYFGRFDIRFKSLEALQRGEEFSIVEINGACSEPLHIWDASISVREKYRQLFGALVLLFEVGNINRSRGFQPLPVRDFLELARKQRELISQYPSST